MKWMSHAEVIILALAILMWQPVFGAASEQGNDITLDEIMSRSTINAASGRGTFIVKRTKFLRDGNGNTTPYDGDAKLSRILLKSDWNADPWLSKRVKYIYSNGNQYIVETYLEANPSFSGNDTGEEEAAPSSITKIYNGIASYQIDGEWPEDSDVRHVIKTRPERWPADEFHKYGRIARHVDDESVGKYSVVVRVGDEASVVVEVVRLSSVHEDLRFRMVFTVQPKYDYAVKHARLYMGNTVVQEERFSDYINTERGYWYPTKSRFITYVPADDGEGTIVYVEEHSTVASEIEFDIEVANDIFNPVFSDDTVVMDLSPYL